MLSKSMTTDTPGLELYLWTLCIFGFLCVGSSRIRPNFVESRVLRRHACAVSCVLRFSAVIQACLTEILVQKSVSHLCACVLCGDWQRRCTVRFGSARFGVRSIRRMVSFRDDVSFVIFTDSNSTAVIVSPARPDGAQGTDRVQHSFHVMDMLVDVL